ncbi:excitatory amino acid transporter 5-like isoform X2 [Salvelinus fontinalis]|uniref:excitatory amino acid transporter 5-like isoform X2 n=1 Tax=Salvelinus fontinalis TaxID=8038 RepID=UPI0024850D72|nr:excitatory amino acid transporter 5-like isoform X2 [Salvelinus fontinalis]
MEELLLPTEGEETRSNNSSYSPRGETMYQRVNRFLHGAFVDDVKQWLRGYLKRNGLLTLSVFAVLTGCVLGAVLRGSHLSTQAKIYFSFPGELLMRMLKMLILPLITSSLMSGLSSMEPKACCRVGVLTVTYYLWTTFIAVVVGILLVIIIKPGVGTEMDSIRLGGGPVMTSADALLDLIRNMVPSNLIEATFQQYKTDLVPILKVSRVIVQPNFVYDIPDESDPSGRTVFLELTPPPEIHYKTRPGNSQQMNVLGIVIFSATMGLLLGKMGERGAPLVNVCQCVNECVMKITNTAVWYFPFGIIFLVAGKILDMQDPSNLGKKLGWYTITVLTGLFVHGLILLPFFYLVLTQKNPFTYIRGLLQALVIALATSSSITATAASIGAAGIPQAGLVTMVIVLTSVGLPPDDITLIVAIDWVLDRFRTMINVLGDALAAGIIGHLCRKDFPRGGTGKSQPSYGTQNKHNLHDMQNGMPLTELPLQKQDCCYEVMEDTVNESPTIYYNICQV